MAYCYDKLKGKIVEVFGTRKRFSDAMGISEVTITHKLQGKIQWKQSEILKACELLNIPLGDIPAYFFALKVQLN